MGHVIIVNRAIEDRGRVSPHPEMNLADVARHEPSAAERFRRCRASIEKRCKRRPQSSPTSWPPRKLQP